MSLELAAAIIAGVSSSLNLLVTVVGFCMTGTLRSECCGASLEHIEHPENDNQICTPNRSSSPTPIPMHVE